MGRGGKRRGGKLSLVHTVLPSHSKLAVKVRNTGIRDLSSQVTIPLKYLNCFLPLVKSSIFYR